MNTRKMNRRIRHLREQGREAEVVKATRKVRRRHKRDAQRMFSQNI